MHGFLPLVAMSLALLASGPALADTQIPVVNPPQAITTDTQVPHTNPSQPVIVNREYRHFTGIQHQNVSPDDVSGYIEPDRQALAEGCVQTFGPGTVLVDFKTSYKHKIKFLEDHGTCLIPH